VRVSSRFVRDPSGQGTTFIPVEGVEPDEVDWDKEDGWKVEPCTPGTLVLIHGGSRLASSAYNRKRNAPVSTKSFREIPGDIHLPYD